MTKIAKDSEESGETVKVRFDVRLLTLKSVTPSDLSHSYVDLVYRYCLKKSTNEFSGTFKKLTLTQLSSPTPQNRRHRSESPMSPTPSSPVPSVI